MKKLFLFSITLLLLYPLTFALPVRADWLLDRSGTLVQIEGDILGDDDARGEAKEELKQRQEKSRETLKNQIEVRKTIQEKTGNKSRVELESEMGQLKLKQEIKDEKGKLIRKQEVELKSGDALHVEQEDGETVRVDARKDGRLEMVKNRVKTNSDLDLQVGEKNEISVTLPNGKTKEIALPDKALERLVANGVIASSEGGSESQYELIAGKNGEPVYRVEGQVEKKLLGLFKLKFAQKLSVAAGSSDDGTLAAGDIVESESQETSPWRRFLERMSSN